MYGKHYMYVQLVSILHQIIKRADEGIAAIDGVGRLEERACDLHRQISIRKNARKEKLCRGRPTLSEVAQPLGDQFKQVAQLL